MELKKAISASGMTRSEVANLAGISERSLLNYIYNTRKLPVDVAQKLAPILGCKWPDFYEPSDPAS